MPEVNAFTLLAALDSAVAVLAGVCARAEGRLESLMGAKGELSTPERLLQRFAAAHSGLSDLLDPPAPAEKKEKQRGLLDAMFGGRAAAPAEPDAATRYPPPVTPALSREPSGSGPARLPALDTLRTTGPTNSGGGPGVENPFDDAPPPRPPPQQAPPPPPLPSLPVQPAAPPPPPPKVAAVTVQPQPVPVVPVAMPPPRPVAAPTMPAAPAPRSDPFDDFFDNAPQTPAPQMPPPLPQAPPVAPIAVAPALVHTASVSRHGGLLTVHLQSAVAASCTETVNVVFQGDRVARACLRGVFTTALPGPPAASPALLSLDMPSGSTLRTRPGSCTPHSSPGVVAITAAGPCCAYQISPEASAAAVPLRLHSAAARPGSGAAVVLAVRVMCGPQTPVVSRVVVEAPAPEGAVGPPLAVSPAGQWSQSTRCVRWELPGVPPGGRALLRASFAVAAVSGPQRPVEASARLLCVMPYALGDR